MKILAKTFIGFFFLFILSGVIAPQTTDAFYVQVKNPYPNEVLNFAIVHYDDRVDKWVVRGWYRINAHHAVQKFLFTFSSKKNYAYIHIYKENASWGSEEKFTVIKNDFEYYINEECPAGAERRVVGFDKYYPDEKGYIYLNL